MPASKSHSDDSDYGLSKLEEVREVEAPVYNYLPSPPAGYQPKIGLIGAGGISQHHLEAYRRMNLDVTHLCDLDVQRAEQRRDAFYPEARVGTEAEMIWNDPEVEVVDIATHPEDRHDLVANSLRAGKHVLCQKPFVLDIQKGEELVKIADQCGRKLAINQNGRWAPHFRYLLEATRAGLIGSISSVDFCLQWDHTWTIDTPFNEIHHLLLYDFAIHWFDVSVALMQDRSPNTVFASVCKTAYQQGKPPMLAHAVIDYADAQVRMMLNAHVQHGQEDRTVVAGQDGTLRAFGPGLNEQRVQVWTAEGRAEPKLKGTWFTNGFEGTMAELLRAIVEDREPSHSGRQNLRSLELCFAAIASANRGRVMRVGEVRRLEEA